MLGKYAATIIACYLLALAVMAGLVVWLVADGRRLTRVLANLEARGVRRRSASSGEIESAPEPNMRS